MLSTARIVAELGAGGQTRLRHLEGNGALTVRPTPTPGRARVHLVAGAFGPLGGDELTLDITLGPGAELDVASVAATVVQRSRDGRPSRLDISVDLAAGAALTLLLPPTVVTAGACHTISTQLTCAADSRLVLREETIRGRSRQPGGDAHLVTRLDVGGYPVLRQSVELCGPIGGPWQPRAVGSLLVIGAGALAADSAHSRSTWLELPRGAGRQFTALEDDPLALSQLLDAQLRCSVTPGQLPRYTVYP